MLAFRIGFRNLGVRSEPEFLNFQGAHESIPRNQFRQAVCSLAGRYDNSFPTRFLALIDCLKIPVQVSKF
jgi:hypothetical protein